MTKKKPALIFVHGFRGGPDGIKAVADSFSDYQVFTPALPPYGEKNTLDKYDLEHYTKFLSNYIIKNKISQPVLIGHSMGSIIVAGTAARYPELVNQKLILLSPISSKVIKPIAKLSGLITILPSRFVSRLVTWFLFIPNHKENRSLYQEALRVTNVSAERYTNKKALAESAVFSSSHMVREFDLSHQNVCIVAGTTDRIVSQKATQKLAQKNHTKTHFIANSGHLINYEAPEKVAKLIRQFLEQ